MGAEISKALNIINRLSVSDRFYLVELIFKDLKKEAGKIEKEKLSMRSAAELLLADYQTDPELTAFTSLDSDDYYETK